MSKENIEEFNDESSGRWHCLDQPITGECIGECQVRNFLYLFGKTHAMAIIRLLLLNETLRFNEILNEIRGSPKTITNRLRDLEKFGLVNRVAKNEIPPRVEYSLTEPGRDLEGVFVQISSWVQRWVSNISQG